MLKCYRHYYYCFTLIKEEIHYKTKKNEYNKTMRHPPKCMKSLDIYIIPEHKKAWKIIISLLLPYFLISRTAFSFSQKHPWHSSELLFTLYLTHGPTSPMSTKAFCFKSFYQSTWTSNWILHQELHKYQFWSG
jgi:hypothetical protein